MKINYIEMISFIVIGRNEGWKLTKCFVSILDTISYNNLEKYEIIYIDSKSTDDSILRAKTFDKVRIFQLTDDINAAIARNVGAKESKGDILFFIDGDMEIIPEFLSLVFTRDHDLKYKFISGEFRNHYYNKSGELLFIENYHSLKSDQFQITTGGLFLIKRELWFLVGGMKTKYKRSQDLDLGLRLSEKGIKLLRKQELLAKHHTISYNDATRMWKMLFSGNEFYRMILFRDHFTNFDYLKYFFRENYTSVFIIITIIAILIFNSILLGIPYLFLIFGRSYINMKTNLIRIPERILYFLVRDILIWFALLFFWKKEIVDIKYYSI